MAVIIKDIKLPVGACGEEIIREALRKCGISRESAVRMGVHKISLDARKREDIKTVSSVWAELSDPRAEKRLAVKKDFVSLVDMNPFVPEITGKISPDKPIGVGGFGPAGMLAALVLAEQGYRPIVLERGSDADKRTETVEKFWRERSFSPHTNVQFGEGGAGTFSDGKLTTRIKDPLCRYVLGRLVEFGAPEEILTSAKPHIGTDRLREIVKNIRRRIISLGGDVRFDSCITDIVSHNGVLTGVRVNGCTEIPLSALIFAPGHSARDTFLMLCEKGVYMEPKPFAIGARIEHTQESIERSLYGSHAGNPALPKGEYQLSYTENGRGVYTFCMCPGGTVVPAQSEENTAVTNGMSRYTRNGRNANSALVAAVSPEDYGKGVLDGMELARLVEQAAFKAAGGDYSAPACTVKSFLEGGGSLAGAEVSPTYACGVTACNFDKILPPYVTAAMRTGLRVFSRRMASFGEGGAVLTAPETRTSSPIRINRGEDMFSLSLKGLLPCGEGAGYAGGIMSAAVDGVRQAQTVMRLYKPI